MVPRVRTASARIGRRGGHHPTWVYACDTERELRCAYMSRAPWIRPWQEDTGGQAGKRSILATEALLLGLERLTRCTELLRTILLNTWGWYSNPTQRLMNVAKMIQDDPLFSAATWFRAQQSVF